jgi:hypothetical protein
MTGRAQDALCLRRIWRQRIGVAAGVAVFLAFALGCMSIQLGGRNEVFQTDELTGLQTGRVDIPPGAILEIYYPVPYQSPPNLTIETSWQDCLIVEQKADHFKVKNPSGTAREVTWKARGLRIATSLAIVPPSPPNASVVGAAPLQ